MSETVQKTQKQRSTQTKCRHKSFREDKTRTTFHLLLCKLYEDFHHSCELIHEVQAPRTVADLYKRKGHPSYRETEWNSWITTSIEKSTWGTGYEDTCVCFELEGKTVEWPLLKNWHARLPEKKWHIIMALVLKWACTILNSTLHKALTVILKYGYFKLTASHTC